MKRNQVVVVALAALLGALSLPAVARQLTDADYAQAVKFLPQTVDPLVDHAVQRVTWLDATHFWYRDHDAAGDHIMEMDTATGKAASAFDQARLAAALGKAQASDVVAGLPRGADTRLGENGAGVSGGEEGARRGPSIMPGGSSAAWPHVKNIFQSVAAKVSDGTPCCDWVGETGAGHYVKMVHNGIEYGDMQLICEAYNIMKNGLGMNADEMHEVFKEWNEGDLESYLIEITRDILGFKDTDGQCRK